MTRRGSAVAALVFALFATGCVAAPPAPGPTPAPAADDAPGAPSSSAEVAWRTEMIASINAQRANAGVSPLGLCGTLNDAAQAHSADQAAHSTMSHTGSNGSGVSERITASGYTGWNGWGENVAVGYRSVASVMAGWMSSPGHRANILSATYDHVGLGLATSTGGTPYWTQDFGRGGHC